MERMKAFVAALYSAALSVWVMPALALAQGQPGRAPSPSGTAPPGGGSAEPGGAVGDPGGAGWLWIVAALVVLAIIWWAMSTRRRNQRAITR
jgi:hypothetical protein